MENSRSAWETITSTFYAVLPFSIGIIILGIIAGIMYFLHIVNKYKKTTYYKQTKLSFFSLYRFVFRYVFLGNTDAPESLGYYGEYRIYENLAHLEKSGAEFLFNLYLPKPDGGTSEIDVVMISEKGIFVFESKNYSGWIFGSEYQPKWYQTFPRGKGKSTKKYFYNPVYQNKNHIKYLKEIIRDDIQIYSIIVFSDRCRLKNVTVKSENTYVKRINVLARVISGIYERSEKNVLSRAEIVRLRKRLSVYTNVSCKIKQQHIDDIKRMQTSPRSMPDKKLTADSKQPISESDFSNAAAYIPPAHTDPVHEILQPQNTLPRQNVVPIQNNPQAQNAIQAQDITQTQDNKQIQSSNPRSRPEPICPRCGGKLVMRTAARGTHAGETFYGCNNYPKCRFVKSVSHEQLHEPPPQ